MKSCGWNQNEKLLPVLLYPCKHRAREDKCCLRPFFLFLLLFETGNRAGRAGAAGIVRPSGTVFGVLLLFCCCCWLFVGLRETIDRVIDSAGLIPLIPKTHSCVFLKEIYEYITRNRLGPGCSTVAVGSTTRYSRSHL